MPDLNNLRASRSLATALLLVLVVACNRESKSDAAHVANGGGKPNATTATDSLAAWRAKFGNRVPRPDSVRALYVNAWASGSRSRMTDLIRIADETEINAFVIDVKESDTYLAYTGTKIPLAKEIGADKRPATTWLPALIDTLQAHNIYPIARIVVFKDRMLAEKKPEFAIRHVNGSVWRDNKGGAWVNPYDRRVWDYNIAIAREALELGFSELQWDYVRFPDVTNSARKVMAYPGSGDKSRSDNIRDFILYTKQQLHDLQVPVTADVFGLVTNSEGDVDIGQNWEKLISTADAVLPMTYPSHYYAGLYGFARPHSVPYEILRLATEDAVERTKWLADSAKVKVGEIRPWLEAMSIRGVHFGPAELRLQMQGAYDSGLKSWSLWNPGSKYAEFLDAL
ncbi:MAG: putative glycoside hydrolase, partial [Gemmatimonadaceae bacterium]